jgi:hypothetical protein
VSSRTLWRVIGVLGAAAVLAGLLAAAADAAAVPNPCAIVPGSAIAPLFGGSAPTGKRSTRPDGAVKQSLCTFTRAGAELQIYVSPHQASGGSGGPPGMVITKPAGLGPAATFVYDLNPKYEFANAYFTKGAFDAGVWNNGKLPKGDILSLAKQVYAALP